MPKTVLPLPPPPCNDKPPHMTRPVESLASSSTYAKLAAVKAYRRALDLLFRCSEKWSTDH